MGSGRMLKLVDAAPLVNSATRMLVDRIPSRSHQAHRERRGYSVADRHRDQKRRPTFLVNDGIPAIDLIHGEEEKSRKFIRTTSASGPTAFLASFSDAVARSLTCPPLGR
jgi:hypothetical protein